MHLAKTSSTSSKLLRTEPSLLIDHPALLLWHVGNEHSTYCDLCADAFREGLQSRYGSLEELKQQWVTPFWSHAYTNWSQIELPIPMAAVTRQH